MKKFAAILLALIMCFNSILISYADSGSFVNEALDSVLKKIDIPANYDSFSSRMTIEKDNQYAFLSWYGDDDGENGGGQINVTVDSKCRIVEFDQYFYGDFKGNYKLSSITRNDAQQIASDFIQKLCPEFYQNVKVENQGDGINRNFEPYTVYFYRYENDVVCYDNYIMVVINSHNAEVSSVRVVWDDCETIYPLKKIVTNNEAKVAMYERIGLVLEYASDANGILYPRYADKSDGVNYINAHTGRLFDSKRPLGDNEVKNAAYSQKNFAMGLVQRDEIGQSIVMIERNEFLSPGKDYNLDGIYSLEDDYSKYEMVEYTDNNGNCKSYIVDLVNNDVRYYYMQRGVVDGNKRLKVNECRSIAEEFCKKYESSFFKQCQLLNFNMTKNEYNEDIYYFNYARIFNNVAYDFNGIVIGVSCATGDVVSVQTGWDVIDAPEFVNILPAGEVYEKYIDSVDFGLQYIVCNNNANEKELRLVFAPDPRKNVYINAVSGALIDENGEEFSPQIPKYTDIANDVSKNQIETLMHCEVFDPAEKFYPDENVTLCDFLLWMCKLVDCVNYKDISQVADKLIYEGIVTYDQLMENGYINTETGIKYIVTYLGYGDIAKLSDTYANVFVDEGMISPDLLGYAAIAKGLKIFKGNAFLPKEYIKRNVAAQIFYNLISY